MQRSTTGTKSASAGVGHRRPNTAEQARADHDAVGGSGPVSFRWTPTPTARSACGSRCSTRSRGLAFRPRRRRASSRSSRGSAGAGNRGRARRAGSPGRTRATCRSSRSAPAGSPCRARRRRMRPPFGYSRVPPRVRVRDPPVDDVPVETLGAYQAPPPPERNGCAQGTLIVLNVQRILPVCASIA